jgi:hypothetical protein
MRTQDDLLKDSCRFIGLLPENCPKPSFVSNDEEWTEINFEWVKGSKKEATVSFYYEDEPGSFGYCYRVGSSFIPGHYDGNVNDKELPEDLLAYLMEP